MSQQTPATLTIIGAGKVGKVLGRLFAQHACFRIAQICNRHINSADNAVRFIGAGVAVADLRELHASDVTMLAVPDDQIAACCAELLHHGIVRTGSVLFHCSGAKSSAEMVAAKQTGVHIASVHPVVSFADIDYLSQHFSGTMCSVEGDAAALEILQTALDNIGATILEISTEHKLLYHAGSVFASNYLVSLIDMALRSYQAAGIASETARQLAAPLARQTLENIFRSDTATALTGPIARGDMETVRKQLDAVKIWDEQAAAVYQSMIAPTQVLATKKAKSP